METNIFKKDLLNCPYCSNKIKKVNRKTIKNVKPIVNNFKVIIDNSKQKIYL